MYRTQLEKKVSNIAIRLFSWVVGSVLFPFPGKDLIIIRTYILVIPLFACCNIFKSINI